MIILVTIIIEYSRPFKIGLIDLSDNLYEKDFIDNSFVIKFNQSDLSQFYFSKTISFNLNDDNLNAEVRAYFNRDINDSNRYSLLTIYSKDKSDLGRILKFIESNLSLPNRISYENNKIGGKLDTVRYCEWDLENNQITSNYYISISDLDELYINRKIQKSSYFNVYLKIKFWLYMQLPSYLVPNWYIDFKQKVQLNNS